jgi:F0F1-type ATP synthase assembly protein I
MSSIGAPAAAAARNAGQAADMQQLIVGLLVGLLLGYLWHRFSGK